MSGSPGGQAADPRVQLTRSPVDGSVIVERTLAEDRDLHAILDNAEAARRDWARRPLAARVALVSGLVDEVVAQKAALADGITAQMGRPRRWTEGELGGFEQRARHMLDLAEDALAPVVPAPMAGFLRQIERVPLGTVLVLSPWNYPYLTAVNAVVPALVAGNTVILKHSDQTPLVAEAIVAAGRAAGIPEGVLQFVHMSHELTARAVADSRVHHVCFTGSVEGGHAVVRAASQRFIGIGLELGGKDAAIVRADADLAQAAEGVVEGALFNSGQSCCGIERVYVHEAVWSEFLEKAVAAARSWTLGDPTDPASWLGPMVRPRNADMVRDQLAEAASLGATGLLDAADWPAAQQGGGFLAPQLMVGVTHDMQLMREETFGPVAGLVRVSSDEEAVRLANDSRYGLTASIWSQDLESSRRLARELEVGTVFLNRCDYLDPGLAWTGVKDSGRGSTLSELGYHDLTRPRSLHFRLPADRES